MRFHELGSGLLSVVLILLQQKETPQAPKAPNPLLFRRSRRVGGFFLRLKGDRNSSHPAAFAFVAARCSAAAIAFACIFFAPAHHSPTHQEAFGLTPHLPSLSVRALTAASARTIACREYKAAAAASSALWSSLVALVPFGRWPFAVAIAMSAPGARLEIVGKCTSGKARGEEDICPGVPLMRCGTWPLMS